MKNIFDLKGKVVIVTGGSRGLGKAMAKALARHGANIVIADIVEDESKKTAKEIQKLGVKAIAVKTDVTKKTDVENLVSETIRNFRKIDILVNNAGILRMGPSEAVTEQEWDKVIAVNLKGQFLCAQTIGKQMIKQKSGNIINIASIAGQFGFPQAVAYDCSKGGVILLTKALAAEWGRYGIRVNSIAPGVFATDMTKGMIKTKQFMQSIKASVPMGRYAKPDELGGAAVFLASDASSYVTGHVLVVDGGWTAGL